MEESVKTTEDVAANEALCPKCGAPKENPSEKLCHACQREFARKIGFRTLKVNRSAPKNEVDTANGVLCPKCGAPKEDAAQNLCYACQRKVGRKVGGGLIAGLTLLAEDVLLVLSWLSLVALIFWLLFTMVTLCIDVFDLILGSSSDWLVRFVFNLEVLSGIFFTWCVSWLTSTMSRTLRQIKEKLK